MYCISTELKLNQLTAAHWHHGTYFALKEADDMSAARCINISGTSLSLGGDDWLS